MRALLVTMLLFPLAGALLQAGLSRHLGRRVSGTLAALAIAGSLVAAVAALWGLGVAPHAIPLGSWLHFDGFTARFSVLYDRIAALMAVTVTFVALLIHCYSATYMRHDRSYARYFCYLNLFVFFMLVITLADDLVFLFLGWEGVGFCSYALIGFWHDSLTNVDAGRKAFLMTRIGDLGFVAALALLANVAGQASLTDLTTRAGSLSPALATALALCFLFAALGKSAQLPLTAWLPDAMAGPTPVSALIHAATMVTAGVYLLVRLAPLLAQTPAVGALAAIIGALTALYGAACALAQRDVKRILAYSTISQVGYMFMAAGCGDMIGAMFHLQTHAFFKSLLFMTAGIMIQASGEEHDIFRMGAWLRRAVPGLFPVFACGALALAGFPLTSGYVSKGRILADLLGRPGLAFLIAFILGTVAALLTALYVFRLLFVAFFAKPAEPAHNTASAATSRMLRPLLPLAVLALLYGLADPPEFFHLGHGLQGWLAGTVVPNPPEADVFAPYVEGLDAILALLGLWLAWMAYGPAHVRRPGRAGFFASGMGLDAAYRRFLAAPYVRLATVLWHRVDRDVLDGAPTALAEGISGLSATLARVSTGRVSISLTMLLMAAAALLTWLALAWT